MKCAMNHVLFIIYAGIEFFLQIVAAEFLICIRQVDSLINFKKHTQSKIYCPNRQCPLCFLCVFAGVV